MLGPVGTATPLHSKPGTRNKRKADMPALERRLHSAGHLTRMLVVVVIPQRLMEQPANKVNHALKAVSLVAV